MKDVEYTSEVMNHLDDIAKISIHKDKQGLIEILKQVYRYGYRDGQIEELKKQLNSVYQALLHADSVGRVFNIQVKNNFEVVKI